nr:hypothetical protein [Tanacetum cinerariifolium]
LSPPSPVLSPAPPPSPIRSLGYRATMIRLRDEAGSTSHLPPLQLPSATLQGQVTALQGQVTALQAHVTTLQRQHGLAEDHIQPELPEEAGGSA